MSASREEDTRKVRYATHEQLTYLNNEAIRTKRNRSMWPESIAELDPTALFPVAEAFLHTDDGEMRVRFTLNAAGDCAWIDIDMGKFEALQSHEVTDAHV